jgi:hypothetical protein
VNGVAKIALLLAATLAAAAPTFSAAAQECPTAQSGGQGFVVEREERSKTEVFHAQDSMVRTVLRYQGNTLLETTQFEGLFELERLDRGRRTVFRPKTNLASLFPLKKAQKLKAEFSAEEAGKQTTALVIQLVVKGTDAIYIGPCKYDVLKIERSQSRGGGQLAFLETDYYSSALKLILAKEYRDPGDRTTVIKFDRIYPIKP